MPIAGPRKASGYKYSSSLLPLGLCICSLHLMYFSTFSLLLDCSSRLCSGIASQDPSLTDPLLQGSSAPRHHHPQRYPHQSVVFVRVTAAVPCDRGRAASCSFLSLLCQHGAWYLLGASCLFVE